MSKKHDYTKEVRLKHNEKAAIVNQETGEVREVKDQGGRPGFKYFNQAAVFKKTYPEAWKLLDRMTTTKEFVVAHRLAMIAAAYTNSLQPLSPESSVREIATILDISVGSVKKIIDKLFDLGVIGKFEVSTGIQKGEAKWKKYWLFNPYLSFGGKVIDSEISSLFDDTYFGRLHHNH